MTAEGVHRAAIGRRYYAAFGDAVDDATKHLDFKPRNDADDRGRLRGRLKRRRRSATTERQGRLRSWRNDCDDPREFPGDRVAILTAALDAAEYVLGSLPPPTT
jgi:hypothetical protein